VFVVLLAVRLVVVRFGTDDVDVARTVVLGFRDITALTASRAAESKCSKRHDRMSHGTASSAEAALREHERAQRKATPDHSYEVATTAL
jgi:hypothetical protein